jgi:hypothetical protein
MDESEKRKPLVARVNNHRWNQISLFLLSGLAASVFQSI